MNVFTAKPVTAQTPAKPARLSWLYLYRMYRFSKLAEKSKKMIEKKRDLELENEGLSPTPAKAAHAIMRYKGRMLKAKGEICFLVPKINKPEKLQSFVEKQAEMKELGAGKKALHALGRETIGLAVVIAIMLPVYVALNIGIAVLAPELFQMGRRINIPSLNISLGGFAIVLASYGIARKFSNKIHSARHMLEIGREKAQELVASVRRHAAP